MAEPGRGALPVLACASLVGLTALPLRAQVCAGLRSLRERPVAVSVDGAAAKGASSVGAGLTVGRSAFLGAFAERATYRNVDFAATQADTRSTNVGGAIGYEMHLGSIALCPVATGHAGTDSHAHDTGWLFGFGVGVVAASRLTIQPTVNIPSGITGGETTFGLSVNLGLGR